jgi:hypothetical protein
LRPNIVSKEEGEGDEMSERGRGKKREAACLYARDLASKRRKREEREKGEMRDKGEWQEEGEARREKEAKEAKGGRRKRRKAKGREKGGRRRRRAGMRGHIPQKCSFSRRDLRPGNI